MCFFFFFSIWGRVALQYIILYMCCDFCCLLSKIFAFIALNVTVILGQCFSDEIDRKSQQAGAFYTSQRERRTLLSQTASTCRAYDSCFFSTDGALQVHLTALKPFLKLPYGLTWVTVFEKNVSMLILLKHCRRETVYSDGGILREETMVASSRRISCVHTCIFKIDHQ